MFKRIFKWFAVPLLLSIILFLFLAEGLSTGDPYVSMNFHDTYYILSPWIFFISCFIILLAISILLKFILSLSKKGTLN